MIFAFAAGLTMLEQYRSLMLIVVCLLLLAAAMLPFAIFFMKREVVQPARWLVVVGRWPFFIGGLAVGVWLVLAVWLGLAVGLELVTGNAPAGVRSLWVACLAVPVAALLVRSSVWSPAEALPFELLIRRGMCVGVPVGLAMTWAVPIG